MSGPKVTVYTLTAEELAALREELLHEQERLLRRKELLEDWQNTKNRLSEQEDILPGIEEQLADSQDWVEDEELRNNVENAKKKIIEFSRRLDACLDMQDNDMLDNALQKVQQGVMELAGQMPGMQQASLLLKKRLEKVLGSAVTELFDNAPAADGSGQQEEKHTEFMDKSVQALLDLQENPFLPPSCRQKVDHAISRMKMANENHQLASFCSIELPAVLKDCRGFLSLWEQDGETYRKLSRSYVIWLQRNGTQDTEIIPFESGAVEKLQALIKKEEEKAEEAAQQNYIRSALTEVMQDMGYDVLGTRDVTKRSGKHFSNVLYQYGEDTAVNVTYADNGQISMELGKLDADDRVPTQAEGAYLETQMVHFCDRFKELEERLQEKGIQIGKRIALAPPTADYAQIINTDDYKMQENAQEETRSIQRKTASPKVFRQAGE